MIIKKHLLPALLTSLFAVTPLWADEEPTFTDYDWLADTQWFVPAANLLAYLMSGTDLTNLVPIADQTLWDITSSANGQFSGTTTATFSLFGTLVSSDSTMTGVATQSGQIRMLFTPVGGGITTVGIGQFRNVGDGVQMEMQMMTGSGSSYITHWAYMTQVPAPAFVPPTDYPPGTLISTAWSWMAGTDWQLSAPEVFGTMAPASFTVNDYVNGYYWGAGLAPDEAGGGEFSLIGSATPEGNILFNLLYEGTLVNLAGQITGDASNGAMALRGYTGTDSFGELAAAQVIPEPSSLALIALIAIGWFGIRRLPRRQGA